MGTAVATSGFSGPRPYCSPTFPSSPGNRTTVCSPSTSVSGTVMAALSEHGYRFAGPIINYPSVGPDLTPFDDTFLRETD